MDYYSAPQAGAYIPLSTGIQPQDAVHSNPNQTSSGYMGRGGDFGGRGGSRGGGRGGRGDGGGASN